MGKISDYMQKTKPKKKPINVKIDPDLLRRLWETLDKEKSTMVDFVEASARAYIEEKKNSRS